MVEHSYRQTDDPTIHGTSFAFGDGADGSGMGVGSLLREAREAQDLDLRQVAGMLRIRTPHLQAIESGRYGDLPGSAYAIGFIRSYADFLGLDGEEMVRRFKQESTAARKRPDLQVPRPVVESSIPGGALILFCAVLVAAVYGLWYYMSSDGRQLADYVPDLPPRLASALGLDGGEEPVGEPGEALVVPESEPAAEFAASITETEPAASEPVSAAAEPAPAAQEPVVADATASSAAAEPAPTSQGTSATPVDPVGTADAAGEAEPGPTAGQAETSTAASESAATPLAVPPAEPTAGTGIVIPPTPPASNAAASAAASAAGRTFGATTGEATIVIRFTQDSWIEVRDARGNLQMARMLKPGDTYYVPSESGLRMKAGNAGGLEIEVNGQPAPRIGESGAVRTITLDAERLLAGTAVVN